MEELEFLRSELRELYNIIDVIEKRVDVIKRKKIKEAEAP